MEIENNFAPIDIAISGIKAQSKQMEIISSNVANARTANTGNGEPYRRMEAIFTADEETGGVKLENIVPDMSEFLRVLDPGNPSADDDGYISMPNVNLPVEMMNLTIATRMYQANTAVLKRYQQMVETTLELLR